MDALRRLAPVHLVAAAYCVGLALSLGWQPSGAVLAAVAGAAAACVAGCLVVGRSARSLVAAAAALVLLFVMVGIAVGQQRLQSVAHSRLRPLVGRSVAVQAVLLDLPQVNGTRASLPVRVERVDGAPHHETARLQLDLTDRSGRPSGSQPATVAFDPCGPLVEGARVVLPRARVEALPPPSAGGFDYGEYLERRGEHVVIAAPLGDLRLVGRRGGVAGLADRVRLAARRCLMRGIGPPAREVLLGMVLGDDEGVDEQVIDDFRRSGLLHIMAVSGENVVLLCGLCAAALTAVGSGRRARSLLLIPVVLLYVLVTGAAPSIVRAGVAGVIMLVAQLASRPRDGLLVLLVPAGLMLTLNPNTLYDVGFQLSFAAVAGLSVLGGRLTALYGFLPRPIAESAGITTAATLATAPVSIAAFGQTSLVAVAANVAGGFTLGPIMLLGMLSIVAGAVAPPLSAVLNRVAALAIGFLMWVAHTLGGVGFAVYRWRGPTLGVTFVVVALVGLLVLHALSRRAGVGLAQYVLSGRRRATVLLVAATVAAVGLVLTPSPPAGPVRTTLTILDVGEGAAALAQTPGGPTTLVDAGPTPLGGVLRAHGVRRIDTLVVSHGHADHVRGLDDVIGSLHIGRAYLPQPPSPDAALDRLQAKLERHGTRVTRCAAPLRLRCGAYVIDLLPTSAIGGGSDGNQNVNDCGLVALVTLGDEHVLLPGDAEGDALARLGLAEVEVLELPHHGSAGGVNAALLATWRPQVAIISVGRPNEYGHPAPSTLQTLQRAGLPCLRTDIDGEVWLSQSSAGVVLHAAHPH